MAPRMAHHWCHCAQHEISMPKDGLKWCVTNGSGAARRTAYVSTGVAAVNNMIWTALYRILCLGIQGGEIRRDAFCVCTCKNLTMLRPLCMSAPNETADGRADEAARAIPCCLPSFANPDCGGYPQPPESSILQKWIALQTGRGVETCTQTRIAISRIDWM